MKEIIEKAILVRSVCNELYENGIISVHGDGIHCDKKIFNEITKQAGSFKLLRRSGHEYPYETVVSIHGSIFFSIWNHKDLHEAFPNIDIRNETVNL